MADYVITARSEYSVASEVEVGGVIEVVVSDGDPAVIDVQAGPPGPPGTSSASYLHTQASPASTWTVNHNLGTRPVIAVRDTGGQEILAAITHASANQALISFVAAKTGTAFCSL